MDKDSENAVGSVQKLADCFYIYKDRQNIKFKLTSIVKNCNEKELVYAIIMQQ